MSDPQAQCPKSILSKYDYTAEKATLAGSFIASILYGTTAHTFVHSRSLRLFFVLGVLTILFFRSIAALLNPVHRREGIKWRVVLYTVAMFSFATVYTMMDHRNKSNMFIDHRPGVQIGVYTYSGPLIYQTLLRKKVLGLIPNLMFALNNWLADGLLVSSLFNASLTRPGV